MKLRIALLFLLALLNVAYAQQTPFHYFTSIGKFNETVRCVAQDKEGRLLLGTQSGLVVYNGFTSRKIPFLSASNKEITALFVSGKKYFALNAHGKLFEQKKDTLREFVVQGMSTEIKWIEIEGDYLHIYTKKEQLVVSTKSKTIKERSPYLFAEDGKTTVQYFGDFSPAKFHITSIGDLVLPNDQEARKIPFVNDAIQYATEVDGNVILCTDRISKGGMISYSYGRFRKVNFPTSLGNAHINGVRNVNGKLMVFTDNGCLVFDRGLKKNAAHWFPGIACTDAYTDDAGNLWIATKSKGLIRIPKGKHRKLLAESISSVQLFKNELIVGTSFFGIVRLDHDGEFIERVRNEELAENNPKTDYDPIFKGYFVQNGFMTSDAFYPLGKRVHGMERNAKGEMYLSTSKGLFLYPNSALNVFLKKSKTEGYGKLLIDQECILLQKSGSGDQLLAATENQLFVLEGEELKEIKHNGKSIRARNAAWFKGSWYVITAGNVVYQIINGKVSNTRNLNQLGVVNVMKLQASTTCLYLLTEAGLYRTPGIHAPFESLKDVMGFDGVFIRDFCANGDEVYLATQMGLFSYVWKNEAPVLARFVVGEPQNKLKKETDNKRFFSGNLNIPVECIDLAGTHNFTLQYRLINEGEAGAWVEVLSEARTISLSNLAKGSYTIELRMIDPVSGLKTPVQKRTFDIPSEWWQLKLLWVSAGVALVLGIQWVMKKLRPKKGKMKHATTEPK